MFCTKCGARLEEGVRFCTKCGTELTPAGSAEPERRDAEPAASAPGPMGASGPGSNGAPNVSPEGESGSGATEARVSTASAGATVSSDDADDTGGPSTAASDADATDGAPASSPHWRKRRRRLLVASCVVLALLVGVVGIVAFRGGTLGGDATELTYGSDGATNVTRKAGLLPLDADGEPLAHYWVLIRRAVDQQGNEIELSKIEPHEVIGTDGFVIGDILVDMPDGTYYPSISQEEGGEERPLPSVNVGNGEGATGGTITIKPDPERKLGADRLFLAKLEAIAAQRGWPQVGVEECSKGMFLSSLTGLAYARLEDFGDGVERLTLAYRSDELIDAWDENEKASWSHAYTVEIWEYDEETDSIRKIPSVDGRPMELSTRYFNGCSGILWNTSGGAKNGLVLYLNTSSDADHLGHVFYGLDDEGRFGHIVTLEDPLPGTEEIYLVNGKQVSLEEYKAAGDISVTGLMGGMMVSPRLSDVYESRAEAEAAGPAYEVLDAEFSVSGTRQATLDLIEELRARIGAEGAGETPAPDGTEPHEDAAQEPPYKEVAYIKNVQVPQLTSSSEQSETMPTKWSYAAFEPEDAAPGFQKINARLHEEYEEEVAATMAYTPGVSTGPQCLIYRSDIAYGDDTYGVVRIEKYMTNWGPHGWAEVKALAFNLETGEEVPLHEAAGVSQDELDRLAMEAMVAYVQSHPGSDTLDNVSEGEIAKAATEELKSGYAAFLVTEKGVTIHLPDHALGYPYSDGDKELLVKPLQGLGNVGDNVRDEYSLLTSDYSEY